MFFLQHLSRVHSRHSRLRKLRQQIQQLMKDLKEVHKALKYRYCQSYSHTSGGSLSFFQDSFSSS